MTKYALRTWSGRGPSSRRGVEVLNYFSGAGRG